MSQFEVRDTDISPPKFTGHLAREELVKQLRRSPKKLSLIQAPPGYGKTGLLCQINHASDQPSLWLNVRHSDNDPVNLIQKIGTALSAHRFTSQGKTGHFQPDGFTPPSFSPLVRSLIDEMNELSRLDIYINDVDFLTEQPVLDILNSLIRYSAPTVRFYITTAKTAEFAYSHLLMENEVASITQEALRFSKQDIEDVFQQAGKPIPNGPVLQQLVDLTEGWPVAIYYIAMNLEEETPLATFIAELGQGQVAFDRYFVERVFERQSPGLKKLMLKLAMLDRFNIELCQLLGDDELESQQLISHIRNNTFISTIDSTASWFRFHQLFNIFLRKRCQFDLSPKEQAEARITAANWFKESANEEEAIDLALEAKDYEQAALWMESAFPTVVVRYAKHVTYLDWFKSLPDTVVDQYPGVRIGYIWSLSAGRQFLSAIEQIAVLERNKQAYPQEIQQQITRVVALVHCAAKGLKDEVISVSSQVTKWLEQWNDHGNFKNINDYHYEMGIAWLLKGFSEKCISNFSEAKVALNKALAHFQAYGSFYGQCWARSLLAVTFAKQGFHHEALKEARDGFNLAKDQLGEKSHPGFGLAALIAAISYEYDELEMAEKYLNGALDYLKEQSSTDMLMAAYETKARLLMSDGAVEEAIGFLKDGIKWAESQALKRLHLKLADELIVWLLRHQRVSEAEQYSSQYDLIIGSADDFQIDRFEHKIAARSMVMMMLENKQYAAALVVLRRLIGRGEQLGHQRRTAEWVKLEAIAYWLSGDKTHSQRSLVKALEIASTQNYYRLFLDDATRLHPVLMSVNALKGQKRYHSFLKTLMGKIKPDDQPAACGVEPLTAKETEIIKLLEQGLSNKQIAAQLFVSEGTLKWHLHNVYSKLQVKNRTMALATARQQGYL